MTPAKPRSPYFPGTVISYSFLNESGEDRTFHLNWDLTARLVQVNYRGEARRVVSISRLEMGTLSESEFDKTGIRFDPGPKPAFYRVELVFRTLKGALLGRYGEYLRVVRPTFRPRLRTSASVFYPGETAYFRVENFGTQRILMGADYFVEQQNSLGEWVIFPPFLGMTWHYILIRLEPGKASECQRFVIPQDMPPGRYRFNKRLSNGYHLTTEFEVPG